MAAKKRVAATDPDIKAPGAVDEGQSPAEPVEEVSGSEIVIRFRDHRGETVSRTFSKEVHGKEFKALAEEFKKTHAARIVA